MSETKKMPNTFVSFEVKNPETSKNHHNKFL